MPKKKNKKKSAAKKKQKQLAAQAAQELFEPLKVIGTAASEDLSPAKKPVSKWKRYSAKIAGNFVRLLVPLKWAAIIVATLAVLAGIAVGVVFNIWGKDLPDVRLLKDANFAETTTIHDREGNVLYRIYSQENRKYLPLKSINKKVIDATISIEDKNFYNHFGFDPVGILRAQLNNMNDDNSVQGASTITQQLARNLYLSAEQTLDRKIKELILSVEIEWYYTKDEIL